MCFAGSIEKEIIHEIGGEEPKEYDRSFQDLCKLAKVSPSIQWFISPKVVQSILENYNDEESGAQIRAAIAEVVGKMMWNERSIIPDEDVTPFIAKYLSLIHVLNGYPVYVNRPNVLYGFSDTHNVRGSVVKALDVILNFARTNHYPPILISED